MIEDIIAAVAQVWPDLGVEGAMPAHYDWVVQSRSRVIVFLFAPNDTAYPSLVVKIPRSSQDTSKLLNCVRASRAVRKLVPPALQETIPIKAPLPVAGGLTGMVEQGLPGAPVDVAGMSIGDTRALRKACQPFREWLVAFQRGTRAGGIGITSEMVDDLVLPLEPLGVGGRHIARTRDICARLVGQSFPLVWAYGDAHPSNVLLRHGRVSGAVDWEGSSPEQWPVYDWFQFCVSLVDELFKAHRPSLSRADRLAAACGAIAKPGDGRMGAALQEETRRFFSEASLDPHLLLPFFLAFLIRYLWVDDKGQLLCRVLETI